MIEALERVPKEEWRREIALTKDISVLRLTQTIERIIESKIGNMLPAEVASKFHSKLIIT
jgi:hypothetical protein